MITAKLSHGGVALYDSDTGRLIRWLMMSAGTPTAAVVEDGKAIVRFADGTRSVYGLDTGKIELTELPRYPMVE